MCAARMHARTHARTPTEVVWCSKVLQVLFVFCTQTAHTQNAAADERTNRQLKRITSGMVALSSGLEGEDSPGREALSVGSAGVRTAGGSSVAPRGGRPGWAGAGCSAGAGGGDVDGGVGRGVCAGRPAAAAVAAAAGLGWQPGRRAEPRLDPGSPLQSTGGAHRGGPPAAAVTAGGAGAAAARHPGQPRLHEALQGRERGSHQSLEC